MTETNIEESIEEILNNYRILGEQIEEAVNNPDDDALQIVRHRVANSDHRLEMKLRKHISKAMVNVSKICNLLHKFIWIRDKNDMRIWAFLFEDIRRKKVF